MKQIFTLLALTISFSMNAQLKPVTEKGTTGQRLSTSNAANHGDIGTNAVDLSYSNSASTTRGATGAASTAMGRSTEASGEVSTAMGTNTKASGNDSTAMGYSTKASGNDSTAMGYDTEASGTSSTAMGNETTASGYDSTAMGNGTEASGEVSTAMGQSTEASGDYSTAMGYSTKASDYGSLVIGRYNSSGSKVTNSATAFSTANTAFVIGNGLGTDVGASDAFKVMFNGDTYVSSSLYLGGTEITSTATELNLLTGATSLGTGILSPVTENSNTGVRLSTAVAANHGDIGSNAVDLSYSNSASTTRGATGDYSTAMGYETTASGDYSTAMGAGTTASGVISTAMGGGTTASETYSTAMGAGTTASGNASTAMGDGTIASGVISTAMGYSTKASDYGSLVIGQFNSSGSTVTNSATVFNAANTAFVIGNGVDGSNTSDAFKVLFNGDATVGNDLTVSGDVVINSDMRLKANILSLGSTLYKLLQIDGKTYTMKRDATKKQKIGLLAQDIEKVFPELVVENKGIKSVNYQGLVPVLINALKEQQSEIDALKKQEKRLERLELIISNMDK